MTTMPENIDNTQWLDLRKTPLINSYRIAKGDINIRQNGEGRIIGAESRDETIAFILIQKGFLEQFHLSYGLTLLDLRKAIYSRLEAKSNAIYISMLSDAPVGTRMAERMYDEIIREIKLPIARIIFRACTISYLEDAAVNNIGGLNAYRQSFEKLVKAADEVIEKIKEELQKGLA